MNVHLTLSVALVTVESTVVPPARQYGQAQRN